MNDPVELDALARGVIVEGRHAFDPSGLTCARVRRAVDAQLARGTAIPVWQGASGAPGWVKYLVGAAVASAVTAAFAYTVWRPKPEPMARTVLLHVPTPSTAAARAPATNGLTQGIQTPEASVQVSGSDSPPAVMRAAPVTANRPENLAKEVTLLASVNSAIQRHDGAQALRLLRTYDQQFKKPVLREERAAAGVLSLCAAGQVDAARAAAKRFQSMWPRSPLTARIVDSCIATK